MSLQAWMRIGQPLEPVMNDYERIFDAWEAGGVSGFVFGRTLFADDQGRFTVPAFPSNPQAYRNRGLEPNVRQAETDPAKEKRLHAMLDNAKARGWTIFIFSPGNGATGAKSLPLEEDAYGAVSMAAVWDEVFSAFPQVDGGIMDGWTESAYELRKHHGNAVFADIPESTSALAAARGYDTAKLERGMLHLRKRFQCFSPAQVRYYGTHGVLSAINLFNINEDAIYWLRWRKEDSIKTGQALRRQLDTSPRRLLLGNGPRSAVFSGMTGLDFHAWDKIVDVLLVKHYFWHRGFDGMYGTVARWVSQVHAWNPDLTEQDCFTVVKAWLGVDLPEVNSLADMDLGFPLAFFEQVVTEETQRTLAAVNCPEKVVPWVDTGRMPHGGDPMTSGDLYRILDASEGVGLKRFLFHNHAHLTSAEWRVISQLCGTAWNEAPNGYWPPATPKPSSY
ncbi:MAG: hypothetical protein QF569_20160 [Candidatus Poribacteria bacterium]|nr:hypothetical protein [Candidatus Poribacteria bacterium]